MASSWFSLIDSRELEPLESEAEWAAARKHVWGQLGRT